MLMRSRKLPLAEKARGAPDFEELAGSLERVRFSETFPNPVQRGWKEFPLARRYYSGYYARIFNIAIQS
jgi:hypothetical protein